MTISLDNFGRWASEGCKLIKVANNVAECECNHLTNFALLIDTSQSGKNPVTLQIITWIGCGTSLAGLCLTLLTAVLFK